MAGFQQVKVNRDLEFVGAAKYQPNVKGPMMTELKVFDEHFVAATTNDWDEEETGCTIAHASVDGGAMTITGDNTATDDLGELSHSAQWTPYFNCGVEVKAKVSQITNIAIAIGFVNAKNATNDHTAGELNSSNVIATPAVTTDAALFIFDTDSSPDVWYCGAIKAGTPGTAVAALGTLAPVADTYFKVRVQTDSNGNVLFYYNGVAVGRLFTATTGALAHLVTSMLTPYVGFICRAQGTQVATVSRITTWQDN